VVNVYLIDNDSLIKLKQYPREVFVSLWEKIEALVDDGRLIAPHEVFREVTKGDDDIEKWAKEHQEMFVDLDAAQTKALKEVLKDFPGIHDPEKTGADADPVLVALCLAKTRADAASHYCVVTEERLKGPGSMRIPNVCQALGLEAIQLLEMFKRERFRF